MKPRSDWTVGGATHPADTLLGIRLSRFLAGARDFAVLFTPGERRALQGFFWCGEKLVISMLDELRPRFDLATPGDARLDARRRWRACPKSASSTSGRSTMFDEESNGEALVSLQDPVTPPSLLLADLAAGPFGGAGRC